MKIKSKAKAASVKLSHGQSVKQTANYQSAEANYSVELVVPNDKAAIARGFRQLEETVEEVLSHKVQQQRMFLEKLGR